MTIPGNLLSKQSCSIRSTRTFFAFVTTLILIDLKIFNPTVNVFVKVTLCICSLGDYKSLYQRVRETLEEPISIGDTQLPGHPLTM